MEIQANHYSADTIKPCKFLDDRYDNSTIRSGIVHCLAQQGHGGCVKGGINWDALYSQTQGSGRQSSLISVFHQLSTWCSHKRLFAQLASRSHPEFFVVLQDDAIFDPVSFEGAVSGFISEGVPYVNSWDLVMIDPYSDNHWKACDQDKLGLVGRGPVWRVPPGCTYTADECGLLGVHALLVRRSSLPGILKVMDNLPVIPLDWLPSRLNVSLAWKPHVVSQARHVGALPPFCSAEVKNSREV